ncbi:hypothetical protein [Aquimarina pacifica]|uniref:hypothetical protein n=1 Tax=Aquimarina pacifica TaxID=1296415 RepID=UPI000472E164|nr:hypothetical protein [Aquimarina pacifica]
MEWTITKLKFIYVAILLIVVLSCKNNKNELSLKSDIESINENNCIDSLKLLINTTTKYKNLDISEYSTNHSIKQWLNNNPNKNEPFINEVYNDNKKLIIGFLLPDNATGLMSNLYDVIIIDIKNNQTYMLKSLSNDEKLFYLDNSNYLNYYRIIYSDKFILNKDWDNPSLKIEKIKLSTNFIPKKEKEIVTICNLY